LDTHSELSKAPVYIDLRYNVISTATEDATK